VGNRSRAVRIALLHYSAPPIVGGVEHVLAAHAGLLRAAGCEVRIVSRRGAADIVLCANEPLAEMRAAVADCDVVIAHNVLTMPFDLPLTEALWTLAAEQPTTRWIGWVHDLAVGNLDYERPWHQSPWNRLAQACPGVEYVAVSAARGRQFAALTRTEARVIPNGLDPAEVLGLTPPVAAFAEEHALFARDIVLIHPTRLLRRKNVEFGLQVLAELRERGRNAVTLITAATDPHNPCSADYAAALRERRDALGLRAEALFVNDELPVAAADVASLYQLADALFFPSRQEGFGLPIIEAGLHRLPIFCADTEPMNSLLAHSLHAFAPDASPAEVATLIERTLHQSVPHRARRETLRRYAWGAIWREHLAPLFRLSVR